MPPVDGTMIMQCVLIKRKPDLTREQFSKYYSQVHGPLVTSLMGAIGADYYEQWHTVGEPGSGDDAAATLRTARHIPHNTGDYDAMAVVWFTEESWEKALSSGSTPGLNKSHLNTTRTYGIWHRAKGTWLRQRVAQL